MMFHCSTIIYSTVSTSDFPGSTVRCSIVPPSNVLLFHHLCSPLSASDVPLFHSLCSTVPPSNVPLFHRQMFNCSTITCFTLQPSLFYGSIIRSSTLPPSDVLLFRNLYSTVPLSYLPLFHHEMFHSSTIRCFTVPPSDDLLSHILCSTVPPWDVPLCRHQMFHCSTIRWSTVPHSLFHCSTIRCFTLPPSLFHCSTIIFFFRNADRFSNKDNELQWTACVSMYVRETGRSSSKRPSGYSLQWPNTGTAGGASAQKGYLLRGLDLGEESPRLKLFCVPPLLPLPPPPPGKRCLKRQVMSTLTNYFTDIGMNCHIRALCYEWIGEDFARLLAACSFIRSRLQCIFFLSLLFFLFQFLVLCVISASPFQKFFTATFSI